VDRQESHELLVLLAVGAGVSEGEFVNRVQAFHMLTGSALSNEASATVRIVPDPTFDCTDVTGKVFDDVNRNGYQDAGETGLSGVRVVSARGLTAITDAYGRYHITCAIVPREGRGSNFVLKLDDRTLPRRIPAHRWMRFASSAQRAVRHCASTSARHFTASSGWISRMRCSSPVRPRCERSGDRDWICLMEELKKAPAVLRLSYLADVENEQLVERRMNAIKSQIASAWQALPPSYQLAIEPEVFWRLGAPPRQAVVAKPEQRDGSR
jgi:hypothetical protein